MIDATGELLAVGLFLALCARSDAGLSGRVHAGRRLAAVRVARAPAGPFRLRVLPQPGAPLLRRHAQRDAGGGAAVHLHGHGAGALEDRRGAARHAGRAVRPPARWPGLRGGHRRRHPRGLDRRGRCRGDHHEPDQPADHAARRLRPEARHRRDRRLGDPGAADPALDRADLHRRHPAGREPDRPAAARQPRAGTGLGRRPVRRCVPARPAAGRPVPALDRLDRLARARALPAAAAARGRAARRAAAGADRPAGPAPADRQRAGLDPGRHRHRHRIGLAGCRRRAAVHRPPRPVRASVCCARRACAPRSPPR